MLDEWRLGFQFSASVTFSPVTIANIKQTKIEYEAGLLNYASARQELDYQVRRLYQQLLLLQANTTLLEQNAVSAQTRYEQTLARQRAGQASNLDELSARLDVQTQRINYQNAVTTYENALDGFKQLLMIPQEETVILEGSLLNYTVTDRASALSNDILSSESMQTTVLRKSIDVLEAQRASAQTRSYSPALTFSWGTTPMYNRTTEKFADSPMSSQFSIMLSMKLDNLFPWSPAKEQVDTIGDAIARQQSLLQESAMNRQNTLQRLRRNIMQSLNTIETLQLNITLAEETYNSYVAAYQRGAADLQNVNTARDNLSAARNRLISEQFNLALTVLELEKEVNIPFGSLLRWE
jgi:outer membrane protein TolC